MKRIRMFYINAKKILERNKFHDFRKFTKDI